MKTPDITNLKNAEKQVIWTADSDSMDKASWTKSEEPIFQQSEENRVYGTGHNSFFKSPEDTEDWILYHANDTPTDGCSDKRSPRAQKNKLDGRRYAYFRFALSYFEAGGEAFGNGILRSAFEKRHLLFSGRPSLI